MTREEQLILIEDIITSTIQNTGGLGPELRTRLIAEALYNAGLSVNE